MTDPVPSNAKRRCVKGRPYCAGPDAVLSDPPRCSDCIKKANEQPSSKGADMRLDLPAGVIQCPDCEGIGQHNPVCSHVTRQEQRPSKELKVFELMRKAGFAEEVWWIQRLETALRGVQSCSTCERCRGAATLALGGTFACIGNCGASVPGPNAYCSACFLKVRAEQRASVFANPVTDCETFVVTAGQVTHYEQPAHEPCDVESQEFYELMQSYRHMPAGNQTAVCMAFEAVKKFVRGAAQPPGDVG